MENHQLTTSANQTDLVNCVQGLVDAQKSLEVFCNGMISCYTVANADNGDFRDLRNQVTADAVTYFKVVKPVSASVLKNIKNYFEIYHDGFSDYMEFAENVGTMKTEVNTIVEQLSLIKEIHTTVVAHASRHAITAENLVTALVKLSTEYQHDIEKMRRSMKELQNSVENLSSPWWTALNLVPILGSLATIGIYSAALVKSGQVSDLIHDVHLKVSQKNSFIFASECVQNYLAPSINAYLVAVGRIQSFFVALQVEMSSMEDDMTKTEEKKSMAKIYFNKIVKRSKEISDTALKSIVYLDAIESTFLGMSMLDKSMSATELWDKMYQENKVQLAKDLKINFEKSPVKMKEVHDAVKMLK